MAELIKPNTIHPDGFVTPPVQPTGVVQFPHAPSSVVTSSTSAVNPVNVSQNASNVPSSPLVTLSTSAVNPVNVTQYASSVPSSPLVPLSLSVVNPATGIQYANSVPSSPVVTPARNIANVAPSRLIPNCGIVSTSSPETQLPQRGILDSDSISFIRSGSCSRRNFAAKLVVALFDEGTRKKCNVSGKMGKSKLNPVLIQYVKSLAFQFYPLEHNENEKGEWAKCVVSIDEINRRLNKPAKTTSQEH